MFTKKTEEANLIKKCKVEGVQRKIEIPLTNAYKLSMNSIKCSSLKTGIISISNPFDIIQFKNGLFRSSKNKYKNGNYNRSIHVN